MTDNTGLIRGRGLSPYKIVQIFGARSGLGTTYEILSNDAEYQRPAASAATPLRIASGGNAADTFDGAGAQSVILKGLDNTLTEIEETLVTAGAGASSYTSASFFRLFSVTVTGSGTRSTDGTSTHVASIVIEDSSANTWGTILFEDIAHGTTQQACYTIPLTLLNGDTITEGFLMSYLLTVNTGKNVDGLLCVASDVLNESAPFAPMVIAREHLGFIDEVSVIPPTPLGPFAPGTDLIAMMRGASTPDAGAAIEYGLVRSAI